MKDYIRAEIVKTPHKVYLAGPIKGKTIEESSRWREDMEERLDDLGVVTYNPLKFIPKEAISPETILSDAPGIEGVIHTKDSIYKRDFYNMKDSTIVLANLLGAGQVSIGTMVELGWASWKGLPIIVVMEKEGNPHQHVFVSGAASFLVDNLDDAVEIIRTLI